MTEDMPAPQPGTKEILSAYFEYFMRQITEDAQLMIFLGAVLSCVPVIYTLYKCAAPYELAIFLYVATTYFTFSFSGMGQYMAAGIALLGSRQLLSQKKYAWLKFAVFILLAYGFHSSAIIMIPFLLCAKRPGRLPLWHNFRALSRRFSSTRFYRNSSIWYRSRISASTTTLAGLRRGRRRARISSGFCRDYTSCYRLLFKESSGLGKTGDILINLGVINRAYIISLYN